MALFTVIAVGFLACKKETEPPLARIQAVNLQFSVDPSYTPPYTYYIPINEVKMSALSVLANSGIDTASIKNIRPGRARLRSVFCNGSLDFLDAVSVGICLPGDNDANCGREVFYRDPTPFGLECSLDLVPSPVDDVREYVLAEEVNIQVIFERLRDLPSGSFDIELEMEFEVR